MEVEEKVKVEIEVDDEGSKTQMSYPGDIVIELNTMANGIVQFETEKLTGCFEALILTSDKPVKVTIESELGYPIYDVQEYIGTTYICIRTQDWNEEGHQIGFSVSPFKLNEKLLLTVSGQNNTNVKFIFRMED